MKPNSSVLSGKPTSPPAMAFFAGLSASENLKEYCTLKFEKMSSFLKNSV
jgi:hypothetical protein